jgi:cell division protein FtsW (lipid II flippase)
MVLKKNQFTIINLGFLLCIIIGMINLVTIRNYSILFAVVIIMIVLIIIMIKEKNKLKDVATK